MAIHYVVKVGGSLFDLPDLGIRLTEFLAQLESTSATPHSRGLPPRPGIVLIAGGGELADVIRRYDARFRLASATAHALAVRAMELNNEVLLVIVPHVVRTDSREEVQTAHAGGARAVFNPGAALGQARLPAEWNVTSDSIAAYFACEWQAKELILLKSCAVDPTASWMELAREGVVDTHFPHLAAQLPRVRIVNLRDESPG